MPSPSGSVGSNDATINDTASGCWTSIVRAVVSIQEHRVQRAVGEAHCLRARVGEIDPTLTLIRTEPCKPVSIGGVGPAGIRARLDVVLRKPLIRIDPVET